MDALVEKIQSFVDDLRMAGILICPSELEESYQALLLLDWSSATAFKTALLCTLVKDMAVIPLFNEVFDSNFRDLHICRTEVEQEQSGANQLELNISGGQGKIIKSDQIKQNKVEKYNKQGVISKSKVAAKSKNPFTIDFNSYPMDLSDIQRMEKLIPLMAKMLASKMVNKPNGNKSGTLDYRRTIRESMSNGGVPINVFVKKPIRKKTVVFALCDVSMSCLQFSSFSLALVYSLEKFYRQFRSFAFIGETDEITSIIKEQSFNNLRATVMREANVSGQTGYTDYGTSLGSFYEKYGKELTYNSHVLIFGDARTNWFPSNAKALQNIQRRVRRVYWFDPEPKYHWDSGDSSMLTYKKYCTQVFQCSNLEELATAITNISK